MIAENERIPFLLRLHLSMAVPLVLGELEATHPDRRKSLFDEVPCEWCATAGALGLIRNIPAPTGTRCGVCDGKGATTRQERNGKLIAERGDIIMYRSKKKGETAKMVNVLVESLAMLAFTPGGVTFGDMRWEAATPDNFVAGKQLAAALVGYARRVRKVQR
jgi:hypothetical protein